MDRVINRDLPHVGFSQSKEFSMKNIIKLFGLIALVAVIGFSMATCGGGGHDDDDIIGGDGSMGSTLQIINAQVYTRNMYGPYGPSDVTFTDTVSNLNYIDFFNGEEFSRKSLNELIEGNPIVMLTSGKLNITLGKPKASSLQNYYNWSEPGITISTTNVKGFSIDGFYNGTEGYSNINVSQFQNETNGNYSYISYTYVDKTVSISGTSSAYGETVTYAMNLKAGWNSVILSHKTTVDWTTGNNIYETTIQTGTPNANHKWYVD